MPCYHLIVRVQECHCFVCLQEREQNYVAMIVAQQRAKQLEEKRMASEELDDSSLLIFINQEFIFTH